MAIKNRVIINPKTGQQVKFIRTGKDTQGKVLEMETTFRAGSTEPHHVFQEGDQFHVAKNISHSMWNASNSPTVVSWSVTPALNTEHLLETNSGCIGWKSW